MRNKETGAPHTAHTTNPVPFIMTGDPAKHKFVMDDKTTGDNEEEGGALCDVAPTILDLMVSHRSCSCSLLVLISGFLIVLVGPANS